MHITVRANDKCHWTWRSIDASPAALDFKLDMPIVPLMKGIATFVPVVGRLRELWDRPGDAPLSDLAATVLGASPRFAGVETDEEVPDLIYAMF